MPELNVEREDGTLLFSVKGERVGWIKYDIIEPGEGWPSDTFVVNDVSVVTDKRGEGYGTRMMQKAVEYAREKGLALVSFHTSNPVMQHIGEKLGFRVVSKMGKDKVIWLELKKGAMEEAGIEEEKEKQGGGEGWEHVRQEKLVEGEAEQTMFPGSKPLEEPSEKTVPGKGEKRETKQKKLGVHEEEQKGLEEFALAVAAIGGIVGVMYMVRRSQRRG